MSHAQCAWLHPHSSSTTAQHSVPALSSEREYLLQSATRSSVWSSCRTERKYRWMSPTIWWRLAVRRLRQCSYPRGERALVRLTTLARTSLLHLSSSAMDGRQILGMLASPLLTQKREASAAQPRIYHSDRDTYVSSSSHVPTRTGRPVAM